MQQTVFIMYTASDQKMEIEAYPSSKTVVIDCCKGEMTAEELEVFLVQLALAQSLIKEPEPDSYKDDTVFLPPDAL